MTLTVYTARITYIGPDRLDVTRAFADAERRAKRVAAGEPFAPTWEIDGGEVEHATRCSCGRGLFVEPAGAVCAVHGAVAP